MIFQDEVIITSGNQVLSWNKVPTGIFGQRVVIPQFEIFSNPTVRITDIKSRRFSLMERGELFDHDEVLVDSNNEIGPIGRWKRKPLAAMNRAVQKARMEIMAQEDEAIFKAMDSIFSIQYSGNKDI